MKHLKIIIIGLFFCLPILGQEVVTIKGEKKVLISERMFGQIEILIKELPALRESEAIKTAQLENAARLEAKDDEIKASLRSEIASLRSALVKTEEAKESESKRADAELRSKQTIEKALIVSEQGREKAEKKLKGARKLGLITTITAAISLALLLF